MADVDKYVLDAAWSKPFVTVDEAVGMLLRMLDGPVQFRSTHDSPTAEEEEFLDGLAFSLVEQLTEDVERAQSALAEAKHDGQPNEVLDTKRAVVDEAKAAIARARTFICDIEDELGRGESSALRTDKTRSSTASVQLTITSLDEWARKKYGIALLPRDASVDAGQERQAAPLAAADEVGKGGRGNRTKQREQEDAIKAEIERLCYDPKLLPRNIPGKSGVKSKVSNALKNNALFQGTTIFDKAWDRLLRGEEMAYAKRAPPPKKSKGETCGGG